MGDLLSAASLLLAIVTVLYGLWYPEIIRELDTEIPSHQASKERSRKKTIAVLKNRAIPLTASAYSIAAVFAVDAWKIVRDAMFTLWNEGSAALSSYNAVETSLVIVVFLAIGLAFHLSNLAVKLTSRLKKLSSAIQTSRTP